MSADRDDSRVVGDDERRYADEIVEDYGASDEDRRYEDDDGRTVADMSGIEGHGSFLSAMIGLRGERKRRRRETETPRAEDDGDKIELTREERRWYILGAMKAALLIFLAFAVGLGLIILLMVLFW